MKMRGGLGVAFVTAAVALAVGWHFLDQNRTAHAAPADPPDVPVTTSAAQVQDVPVYLDGLGTVQAFNVVEIKAQVNGTLVALPAREGQEVKTGDVVAEIDPRPYQAALDQAMAQRDEDTAQLQSAQLDLSRYSALAKKEFAPVQQVDDQSATVNKFRAAIAADNAMIETARINLGYCVIKAPFNGRVSLYQLDVGNLVQTASQTGILTITQDKPIAVVFTLPEADLDRVQDARAQGTPAVLAMSSDGKRQLASGVLLTPNNTIDTATGTIALKAQFANDDDRLWPGEFVNARVQVGVLHHAVTVPPLAVERGPDGPFVYVVKPDHTVAQAPIKLGYQDGGRAVVTSGLAANDVVVVTGQSRLSPGTRVAATDAARAPTPTTGSTGDDGSSG